MSGGHWDYIQHQFSGVSHDVEDLLRVGRRSQEELEDAIYDKFETTSQYYDFMVQLQNTKKVVDEAVTYVQRLDWLLSGDDGVGSYFERLKEELKEIV